jgi:serine/threonine-protein kinase
MIGTTLGHSRIVEKLGEGGMGVVFRAHDEHLQRDVAVKVLPPGTFADDAARKRFRKEALALSKLNHPNIGMVFDFDTQDGIDFLVMEFIPGQTLDKKLAGGPLPEREISRLGMQLAEGLAAAHDQGVVHRDLKPGNLPITPDGRLKILDFGVAKLVEPAGQTGVTIESVTQAVSGTLPYMAPEQLRGERIDVRTDIHAAGMVIYEMATGQRPFREETAPRLTDAILHQMPTSPRAINPRLSPEMERITLKCLEKDPEDRYQSAKELLVDLRRVGTVVSGQPEAKAAIRRKWFVPVGALAGVIILALAGYLVWQRFRPTATPPEGKIMLAVLPFENLSGDPEQEYFSDGITEEMISRLGNLQPERLGVIARTSAMAYKKTKKHVDEIARELGVDYLLEGSVRRSPDRVRITAQLIQAHDQTHLWAESYERDFADVFAVQSEVAEKVSASLALRLLPERRAALSRTGTVNPEAHEAYVRGRYYWEKRTKEGLEKSIEYFNEAIRMDPGYALAYAGLADSYYILGDNGYVSPRDVSPKAREAAQAALRIDGNLAEALTTLGNLAVDEWDLRASEKLLRHAVELSPNYGFGHQNLAFTLSFLGRHDEAITEVKLARKLDPISPRICENVGYLLYLARRYDEAITELQKAMEVEPKQAGIHENLGLTYMQKRQYSEAVAAFNEATALEKGLIQYAIRLGCGLAAAGRRSEALKLAAEMKERSKREYVSLYELSKLYLGVADREEALQLLQKAFEARDPKMAYIKVDPELDALRSEPRFQELVRRMNFPE